MDNRIGEQYDKDDHFKRIARQHQSAYRANVLCVGYEKYGNRLISEDARKLVNYYDQLNVREELRKRYANYSKERDANMLRSEHIPFNLFAPLISKPDLAKEIVNKAFGIVCSRIVNIKIEYAPGPKTKYLNDATSFDVYIEYENDWDEKSGIGIEVKYTENSYPIGKSENNHVNDISSRYWEVTNSSGVFLDESKFELKADNMRQIWRNHLLGLAMIERNDIINFSSIILYPKGNIHFETVIPEYQRLLREPHRFQLNGCTYENYIKAISGNEEIELWRRYLVERYLV